MDALAELAAEAQEAIVAHDLLDSHLMPPPEPHAPCDPKLIAMVLAPALKRRMSNVFDLDTLKGTVTLSLDAHWSAGPNDIERNYDVLFLVLQECRWAVPKLHWVGAIIMWCAAIIENGDEALAPGPYNTMYSLQVYVHKSNA
jgi:hypothetical protein